MILLAGGAAAQATSATSAPDSGSGHDRPQQTDPTPTPTPRHATPEPCPGEDGNTNAPAEVVSTGHVALFDVYWDDDEGELANNPCPPTVVHKREQVLDEDDDPTGEYTYTHARTESDINIEETIIHIPNTAQVTLNENDYPKDKYQAVWTADDAENPSGDGDRLVWVLPECPDGALADSLCIGVSADLLNPEDWGMDDDAVAAPGPVQFLIDHDPPARCGRARRQVTCLPTTLPTTVQPMTIRFSGIRSMRTPTQ